MFKHTSKPGTFDVTSPKGPESTPPSKIVGHIRTQTLLGCEQLLAHMFSAVDDLFYDLSKRASSNNEANLYFEAMREIRINREGTAKRFLHQLGVGFSHLLDRDRFGAALTKDSGNTNLSLVEGDDLEIDLARTTMISSARALFHEDLYALSARFNALFTQEFLNDSSNPLDPEQITKAFIVACQDQLHINIKARLIVFKLFEKHVLKQLGHIYHDANHALVEAGLLPELPRAVKKQGAHTMPATSLDDASAAMATAAGSPAPTHSAQPPSAPFFMGHEALSLLLAAVRHGAAGFNVPGSNTPSTYGHNTLGHNAPTHQAASYAGAPAINCFIFTSNPGPVMSGQELASRLSQSQPVVEEKIAQAPRNVIGDIVSDLLASNDPELPHALDQDDENVINLVALFFDHILADEHLPSVVQSLICRLQIPILRVAIKNRSFFDDPEHPARLLINSLCSAGLELDDSRPLDKDPAYKKMLDVVQHICAHQQQDDAVFVEAREQLLGLLEKEKRKSTMVEQRTLQAEEGQYRMLQARLMAQNLVYEKIKDQALPDEISEFLCGQWLQVLVFLYLRFGEDSAQWMGAEQSVIDLVWLSHDHKDQRSQQRRERMLPELLDRLDQGLEGVVTDALERNQLVDNLEVVLKAVGSKQIDSKQFHNLTSLQKEELGRGDSAQKSWQEMSVIERQMARHEELFNQYYVEAKDMPLGTWLIYSDENSKLQRCKLSSKIDSETYLFVNRLGFKVLEKSRKRLALDLQNGKARVINTQPFFDRMMNLIVTRLESAKEGTADA
ncbi:MAG: hypothetical protein RL497_626 [Pseudomonadota bacterium]|jgi:hypothetical protein